MRHASTRVSVAVCLALLCSLVTVSSTPSRVSAGVAPGFSDVVALDGLSLPTNVAFAPDGRIFVTEKRGMVKVFAGLGDPSASVVADLRTDTFNYGDSGMTGLAIDPAFPARPFIYVTYQYDAPPGGTAPTYGVAGADDDSCGPQREGCVKTGRVVRLTLEGDRAVATTVLLNDTCQSSNGHAINDVQFGPDGALYVSAGDGASAAYVDYGQYGNVCADPPVPAGAAQSAASSEGGALRVQDVRTPGDPTQLSGTVVRIHPDTGEPFAGNPMLGSADVNTRRIIAYGLRNPFRFAFRPGTQELYVADVGWKNWEEIDLIADVDDPVVENFGWPCYEGRSRQSGYAALNNTTCESLYSGAGGAPTQPWYTYKQSDRFITGGACAPLDAASNGGVRFYGGGDYPSEYDGALFFADYARGCLMVMRAGPDGRPEASTLAEVSTEVASPVDLEAGPRGDLFYVDIVGGKIRRIVYDGIREDRPPVARATASPVSGPTGTKVTFDGSGSTDPEGAALTYRWDLDFDGAFDDGSAAKVTRTFDSAGRYEARLRVSDPGGRSDQASVIVQIGDVPTVTVASGSETWSVGERLTFRGSPPPSAHNDVELDWKVTLFHCEDSGGCHPHPEGGGTGDSITLTAPDHSAPAYLEVQLTAKDSSRTYPAAVVRVPADEVQLTLASDPSGLVVAFDDELVTTPAVRTVIPGSTHSVSAGSQSSPSGVHDFAGWSDGGAASHGVIVPATDSTLTAVFETQVAGQPPAQDPGAPSAPGVTDPTVPTTEGWLRILTVRANAPGRDTRRNRSINRELVQLRNDSDRIRRLTRFTLRDRQRNVYTFPRTKLAPGEVVTIRTGDGRNRPGRRYWGLERHVWGNVQDRAQVRDRRGRLLVQVRWGPGVPPPTTTG